MANELVSLKSLVKAENIQLSPDSFGGSLDPMFCDCVCILLTCDPCIAAADACKSTCVALT